MSQYNFVGFSTINRETPRDWRLYNKELIKRDILNELYTRKGERVMLPTYGSIIWDMLMEPLTQVNKNAIVEDITRIVTKDTRTRLIGLNVTDVEMGIRVEITLEYLPFKTVESFYADFEQKQTEIIN